MDIVDDESKSIDVYKNTPNINGLYPKILDRKNIIDVEIGMYYNEIKDIFYFKEVIRDPDNDHEEDKKQRKIEQAVRAVVSSSYGYLEGYQAAQLLTSSYDKTGSELFEAAMRIRPKIETMAISLSDEEAIKVPEFFSEWLIDKDYTVDDRVRYLNKLFKCIQSHRSQEDWDPQSAVSLWVAISDPNDEWPLWNQPNGSHDAYSKGDKVTYNGNKYISNVDHNVWIPGSYGWDLHE